jgi:hypothetical protein
MTVESFFELYTAIFGWQQYNQLWNILTSTGLAYLPFLIIVLLNIIGPLTSQETRDAATTSVKRMEVDLFIAFSVVVLAAAPAIDLSASVLTYKKPCDTISGPAGTFSPGATGTTFDAVFSDVIATPAQVPVWWWGVMAISSGINREAIAHIGCPPDLSGFQMEIARTRIQDPELLNEVNKFVRYCYRPARAKFEREQPDVTAILEEHGPDDLEWIGSHVLLEALGYYDNPHFRPREGIHGWPLDRSRDTEYPDPVPPDLDPTNIGRPLCNDWWTNGERGLRGKLLAVIEPEVLGEGIELSSEFVIFGGSLTQEKVEDALLKSIVGTSLATAPSGSAFIPSLNDEDTLSLSRLGGGLDLESLSFAPMMYVVRAALPIFQALILSGLYVLLPFALLAARYNLQSLLLISVALFTVKFWSYLWHLAKWLEDNLIKVLYPDGLSWFKAHTQFFFSSNYLIGGDFALKHEILNFATGLMYIVLPMIFSFLMGVVGLGTAVGFAAIVAALSNPIQRAGRRREQILRKASQRAL